jgi:hypothetical protein
LGEIRNATSAKICEAMLAEPRWQVESFLTGKQSYGCERKPSCGANQSKNATAVMIATMAKMM